MLVLGLDVGGTSTRAVLCSADGALLGRGTAAGGNPRSNPELAADHLQQAIGQALARHPARQPAAVAVGAAGAGHRQVRATLEHAVRAAGIVAPVAVVPDIDIAFRAGGIGGDGVLLLSGTGAVAARYRGYAMVQRCDGMGWLLGDEGSGVWMGQRVLQAVAADLDHRGPATALTAMVLAVLRVVEPDPRQALVEQVHALSPSQLGRFAPLALNACQGQDADAVALSIVEAAAALLCGHATTVGADAAAPLVTAGGMLARGALADRVRASFPLARHVTHPVVGACGLAAEVAGTPWDAGHLSGLLQD